MLLQLVQMTMYLDKVVAIKHAALDLDLFEWCIIYNENSHKSSLNSIGICVGLRHEIEPFHHSQETCEI